ncbi:MAG: hypothetical protein E7632_06770 [Ruminococcaceae bacterium]|nr:hypothetical protein [Oscillospiraceae bacterium]
MKRTMSLLLIALLAGSAVSCGDTAADSTDTNTSAADSTSAEVTYFNSELPDKTFGGYEFRILTTDEVGSIRYSYEFDAEAENGDIMNDAVFKRNTLVEDKLDVVITQVAEASSNDQFVKNFKQDVLAGDHSYDVLVNWIGGSKADGIMSLGGEYGLEVSKLPYIDLDSPWWDGELMRQTAVGGKIFGLSGDINIIDNSGVWCLLFNKDLANEFLDEDLYDTVNSGKWTLDAFNKTAQAVTFDLDGNGTMDTDDRWGATVSANLGMGMMWSCGGSFGTLNSDGTVELTIASERNLEALAKIQSIVNDTSANLLVDTMKTKDGGSVWVAHRQLFHDGNALYIGGPLNYVDYFRDMESEYGILPLPKYDENQKEYISTVQEWCATMLMVPRNAEDPERTSIILDAMCSAAVNTITPAYYDVVLRAKLTRDEESYEMLDLIFDSRQFDVVYAFNWGKISGKAPSSLKKQSSTIASDFATLANAVEADYQNTLTLYAD